MPAERGPAQVGEGAPQDGTFPDAGGSASPGTDPLFFAPQAWFNAGDVSDIDADTIHDYKHRVSRYWGYDLKHFKPVGAIQTEKFEKDGKQYEKRTGEYLGKRANFWMSKPYADDRLPAPELEVDGPMPENYKEKMVKVTTDNEWSVAIQDLPWSSEMRMEKLVGLLEAKAGITEGDHVQDLQMEGVHGMWELSLNTAAHLEIPDSGFRMIVQALQSEFPQVQVMAAKAVWGLGTTIHGRAKLVEAGVMEQLLDVLYGSFSTNIKEEEEERLHDRNELQKSVLGALFVLCIDKVCRDSLMECEENFGMILLSCSELKGYNDEWQEARQFVSAKILYAIMLRDADTHEHFIKKGHLKTLIEMIDNDYEENSKKTVMLLVGVLSMLAMNKDAMEMALEQGQCHKLASVAINTLMKVATDLEGKEATATDFPQAVKLAEDMAQTFWGSSYALLENNEDLIAPELCDMLCEVLQKFIHMKHNVTRVKHQLTAALAAFCSSEPIADLLIGADDTSVAIDILNQLVQNENHLQGVKNAPLLRTVACAGLAYLASHPLSARYDECLEGTYRTILLDSKGWDGKGCLETLLESIADPPQEEEFRDKFLLSAASVIMFLASVAEDIELKYLELLLYCFCITENEHAACFLITSLWILLRNPVNRVVFLMDKVIEVEEEVPAEGGEGAAEAAAEGEEGAEAASKAPEPEPEP